MVPDTARYQFIAHALDGSGGFRPKVWIDREGLNPKLSGPSFLVRYPRESAEKFARRNEVAWYRNFLKPACVRFAGYLAKKPPRRALDHPLLTALSDDCDWQGNSLDVFWSTFAVETKARGSMLLLVDMPQAVPPDRASQIEQRAFPYLAPIPPERVVDYTLNVQGLFESVAIASTAQYQGQTIDVWRVWDTAEWRVQRPGETGEVLESGIHGLGLCPVLAFTESGSFPDYGDFEQIAVLSRRYFNAASERDEILRGQTFSLLTYQIPPEAPPADLVAVTETVGVSNMLIHNGDTPAFIAPPDGPATIYNEVIAGLEEAIRRIAMTVEQPTQAESGIALTIRFQELNSALARFARRMEDLERRMWDLACRWLSIQNRTESVWPKSFELADVGQELTVLQQMQAAGFPDAVIREGMKAVVGLQFATAEAETMDAIIAAIDEPTLQKGANP
jgi:hypothetical protein